MSEVKALSEVIGSNIRSLRLAAHMKQTEVATVIGVAPATLQQWEMGAAETITKYHILTKLAAIWSVSVEDLCTPDKFVPAPLIKRVTAGGMDAEERRLIKSWRHGDMARILKMVAARINEDTGDDAEEDV